MIVYRDAIVSAQDLRPDFTPIGVAVNERLMVAAVTGTPTPVAWGPAGKVLGLPAYDTFTDAYLEEGGSGKDNSILIATHAAAADPPLEYPANAYARGYTPTGVEMAGQFFLPNAAELHLVYEARDAINASLSRLGSPVLDGLYWTSVQAIDKPAPADPNNITKAWVYNLTPPGTAPTAAPLTTATNRVLPMAEIPSEPL
jgi:hypothetical protein